MRLIDEWKSAWKFASVNCMALAAAIQGTFMSLSDDMKAALHHNLFHIATIIVLVAGIGGRLVTKTLPEDK